jgi:flagellar L-ring protein precursor FlgH
MSVEECSMKKRVVHAACFAVRAAVLAAVLSSMFTGCSTVIPPKVDMPEKMTAKPAPATVAPVATGAIFQDSAATHRPLFEDRRARYVGDTLTIQINEKTQAASDQSTTLDRKSSLTAAVPGSRLFGGLATNPLALTTTSDSKLDGSGKAAADNVFTGTITVTVIEVLHNGNLIVAGEKQIGIGQNMETLRFSGVVNPTSVLNGNVVSSTQVADARLETRGKGGINEAQTVGWLSRFFMTYWPF